MAKLVLSRDGSIVDQCFLDDTRVTVGRDAGNRVVVNDPAVGREHAAIIMVGKDFIIEDLGSVNGTSVNGTRVKRRILQHGDVIELGAFHLRYLDAKASSELDFERTMLIAGLETSAGPPRAASALAAHGVRVPRARATKVNFPVGRVNWMAGPRGGETTPLNRVVATFGTPRVQVAVITRRPHGYFVTHVEGRSFPRVNGQSIGAEPRALAHGDIIEVGCDRLEFRLA